MCVFDSVKYNIPLSKYKVFNNPVINIEENINNEFHAWFEDRKYPIICMSGRLDKNKNYYLALKIIKEVLKVRKVRLIIMGEGEEHKNLEDEVKKLDISDFVDLMGYVNNPLGYINQCDIFLHTAILESFGNVIVEALFCNKPIISTNCKGPEYILNHGEYGVLIGKSEDNDVIQNGVQAILDILDGNIKFENLKSKALEYNADFLEKDFIKYFYRKERG